MTHQQWNLGTTVSLGMLATLLGCYGEGRDTPTLETTAYMVEDAFEDVPQDTLSALIDRLRSVPGVFTDVGEGIDLPIDVVRGLLEFEHAAVERLVDCMDSTKPSAARTHTQSPVPLGFMCWYVLVRIVHYEPVDDLGFIDADWVGMLSPWASAEDLSAAQDAWKAVVRARSYGIP